MLNKRQKMRLMKMRMKKKTRTTKKTTRLRMTKQKKWWSKATLHTHIVTVTFRCCTTAPQCSMVPEKAQLHLDSDLRDNLSPEVKCQHPNPHREIVPGVEEQRDPLICLSW